MTTPREIRNPFLFAYEGDEIANAREYAMVKSGPSPSAEEVECDVVAIEVTIAWETNVLHVAHLAAEQSFVLGEGDACDFLVPREVLGASRTPLVVARAGDATSWLIVPARATGTIEIAGRVMSIADAVAERIATPSSDAAGAFEIPLHEGTSADITLAGSLFVFHVGAVNAGKRYAGAALGSSEAMKPIGLSFFAHAGILASLAFFMPHLGADDSDAIDRDNQLLMQKFLTAAAERENPPPDDPKDDAHDDKQPGGGNTGAAARTPSGTMGSTASTASAHHFAVEGPADNGDPHISRVREIHDAETFGILAMLAGARNKPITAWGRDDAAGRDSKNALGVLWAPDLGEAVGVDGLGLTGTGLGGGGDAEGIGVGKLPTIMGGGGLEGTCRGGPCMGKGDGPGGFGIGAGPLGNGYKPHQPKPPREGVIDIGGQIPREVIQRIVRQNFGRFRTCYEEGLRTNPSLSGRVAVKFIIDRTGSVSFTGDGGSDIPNLDVVSCVARQFYNLSFPAPQGGIVTVVYPLVFSPSD